MGAWKQFLASDIIITPFEVNKGFSFSEDEFSDSDVQINRFLGVNNLGTFYPTTAAKTGANNNQYQTLVYNSIKELYYSNFLTASYGDNATTSSILPGEDEAGNVIIGSSNPTGRFDNYLQSTLTPYRYFPTGSSDKILVFSIPNFLFGDYIQPSSFIWDDTGDTGVVFTDDGEGNILASGSISGDGQIVGNIIYTHGIIVLTNEDLVSPQNFTDFIASTQPTCSFSSSYTIYETQYKTTINENEFNFSQNPSLISGSTEGTLYGFVTSSYFQPYVTTVGLYNEAQELLAVGKLSQPLSLSKTTDTSILINLDR
jgi:hypothetical protein